MSFENGELRAFAARLAGAGAATEKEVVAITKRGAVNIKAQQNADFAKSQHFGQIAGTVNFDIRVGGAFGGGFVEAEIGPDKRRRSARLANVAIFGTSRGGGTVADPAQALAAELPGYTTALLDAMSKPLEG